MSISQIGRSIGESVTLKLNETAEIMNVTVGTVKSLLFRAIRKLRKELSPFLKESPMEISHE